MEFQQRGLPELWIPHSNRNMVRTRSQGPPEKIPLPPPPPPPPPAAAPPPPPPAAISPRQRQQQPQPPAAQWILNVRSPYSDPSMRRSTSSSKGGPPAGPPFFYPSIVRLEITPRMSPEMLANCLQHALRLPSGAAPIAGLFVEKTSLFRSLQEIVQGPPTPQLVYTLHLNPPPPRPPRQPSNLWFFLSNFLLVAAAVAAFFYWDLIMQKAYGSVVFANDSLIRLPLKEVYRYGPSFLGWQGMQLPAICVRITLYGDYEFWTRNLADCQGVYNKQEAAFLGVAQPLVYALCFSVLIYLIRLYWHDRQEERRRRMLELQQRPGMLASPEMVETHRAIQVLLQQVKRSWTGGVGGDGNAAPAGVAAQAARGR